MVKELHKFHTVIHTVMTVNKVVGLSIVLEHPRRFAQTAQSHKILNTLIPGNCSVIVIVHYQKRCLDIWSKEYR